MQPHTATTNPTTTSTTTTSTAPILYRLADDPTIRWAKAGELAWGEFADDQHLGQIAEWEPLVAGPWRVWVGSQHAAIELPVLASVLVEVRLADDEPGVTYLDEAGHIGWAGVDGMGAVVAYRTWTPATASTSTTPTRAAPTRRLRALPRRHAHSRAHVLAMRRPRATRCPWWAM